jgi:hypothetical protein
MKGTQQRNNKIFEKERGETAQIVASMFKVTASYVRKVIADTNKSKYKGANPDKIRIAYTFYEHKATYLKNELIKEVEKLIKVA